MEGQYLIGKITQLDRKEWTGFIWLRIWTSEGFLWTWYYTYEFHKMWGMWLHKQL